MSADNGIYIGRFPKAENSSEFEFRVIHAQAIDNIYFFNNEEERQQHRGENPRGIVEYFGEAEVLDEKDARQKAFDLEQGIEDDDFGILEYGISSLAFSKPFSFYKEHAHEIVYDWDKEEQSEEIKES
jgi:hypothetical protein